MMIGTQVVIVEQETVHLVLHAPKTDAERVTEVIERALALSVWTEGQRRLLNQVKARLDEPLEPLICFLIVDVVRQALMKTEDLDEQLEIEEVDSALLPFVSPAALDQYELYVEEQHALAKMAAGDGTIKQVKDRALQLLAEREQQAEELDQVVEALQGRITLATGRLAHAANRARGQMQQLQEDAKQVAELGEKF